MGEGAGPGVVTSPQEVACNLENPMRREKAPFLSGRERRPAAVAPGGKQSERLVEVTTSSFSLCLPENCNYLILRDFCLIQVARIAGMSYSCP